MKKIAFLFCFFSAVVLFGNDYHFYQLSGGTIVPASDNETYIELVDEVIVFELFDTYYTVTVDFNFYNYGEEICLLVGFPYTADSVGHIDNLREQGSLFDFETWVNGNYAEIKNSSIEIAMSDQKFLGVNYAYTKEVTFPSRQHTQTKVKYNAKYGKDGAYWLASYFYGSGKGWYDCIGKAEVIIKNNSKYWIYGIKTGTPLHSNNPLYNQNLKHNWNGNDLCFILEKFEPEYNDTIEIFLWIPMFDFGPKPLPNYFYYKYATFVPNDLWYLTKAELRILRNLFYALYGYNFKDLALKEYFSSNFGFYEVNPEFTETMLTETERQNIEIIMNEEAKRK